jgi:SAM-dependent methyltransferase
MNAALLHETERLRRAWERHEVGFLHDYLVAGVEDPRRNLQSVLTRHFLLTRLCGERFQALRQHELRFAAAMNWLADTLGVEHDAELAGDLLFGLQRGADNVEGTELPHFALELFGQLPAAVDGHTVPNYLERYLANPAPAGNPALHTFQELWSQVLAAEPPAAPKPTVVEPACGSANDYRFLAAFGLSRLVDYAGFDLSEKNIANAQALFPGRRFAVGNVLAIAAPDRAFDCAIMHDLFEHLSAAALPVAVSELCRVTQDALCVGCFGMDEIPEHIFRPMADYHWNTLSLARMKGLFSEHGFEVTAIHIGSYLNWLVGSPRTHNPNAYTLVMQRPGQGASAGA